MIRVQFEVTGPDFEEVSKRHFNAARKHAAAQALGYLLKRLPKRFDGSMKSELGFAPRKASYEATKDKIRPGTRGIPLKFTGRSMRRAEQATLQVKALTSAIVITGLDEAFGRRGRVQRRNRDELTRVSRREEYVMGEIYARELAKKLNELLAKTRKKEAL